MAEIPKSNQSRNRSRNYKSEKQIYRRWDQVPRSSKHPLSTGHTRREPSSMIMNAELSKSVCQVKSNHWYEICQITYGLMKVCNYELDHCKSHRTCKMLTSNETVEIPVTSTCLSVVYLDSKTDRMLSRPLHIKSVER
jgi:hypothetical protein